MKNFELSIPKPCHENWNAMTPEDKGRFCGACQKTVIDFSVMSDRQLAQFFKQPVGSVCGRFNGDQLERVIEVPRKRIPWVRHFFTIALPAFLLSLKSTAQNQQRIKGRIAVCEKPQTKGDTMVTESGTLEETATHLQGKVGTVLPKQIDKNVQDSLKIINGLVMDESGQPLAGATITLKGSNIGVVTNNKGEFSIKQPAKRYKQLVVSYVGFESQTVAIDAAKTIRLTLTPAMMGEVIVTGLAVRKPKKQVPVINLPKKDSMLSKFSVFPNPVDHNSAFTIGTKDIEAGAYIMTIITSTGEIVQAKELVIEKKNKRYSVQIENLTAAPYFVRLTNKGNNKSFTEILLVK